MALLLLVAGVPANRLFPAFLLLFFLSGLAAAAPLKKTSLQLDWYPDAERAGFFCALVNGYYREAGLDVELLGVNPSQSPIGMVLAGRADFAMVPGDQVLISRSQGLPVVAVMATMQHDPQAIMVHAGSPVKSFSDLEGCSIAVSPGASWFRFIIAKYGLKQIRELRLNLSVATFLRDPGYIQQVFITSEPYLCRQAGVAVRTLLIKDTGCDPYRMVAASDKLVASDPALVDAFVKASIRGWAHYLKDPASTDAEIKKRNPQMTQELLDYSRTTLRDGHFVGGDSAQGETFGRIDPRRVEAQYKLLRGCGVLAADTDFSASYTTRFCNTPAAGQPAP